MGKEQRLSGLLTGYGVNAIANVNTLPRPRLPFMGQRYLFLPLKGMIVSQVAMVSDVGW